MNNSIAFKEDKKSGWREKQKLARLSGKSYLTQKEKRFKPAKQPPAVEVSFNILLIVMFKPNFNFTFTIYCSF